MRLRTTNLYPAGFNHSVPCKKELLVTKGGMRNVLSSSLRLWNGVLSRLKSHVRTKSGAQQVVGETSGSNEIQASTPDPNRQKETISLA